MTSPKEIIYRNKISSNLNLVESGLSLIEEEYKLENSYGTRGYVDILCRDKYGHTVIIEIKRSKAASRQALHELHKYVALIKANSGLAQDEIRCILISTDWSELIVPFSEFYHQSSYQIIGYKLESDSDGNNISTTEITPLDKSTKEYSLYYKHYIYLYDTYSKRKNEINTILSRINASDMEGGVLLHLDYCGNNNMVIYKYLHYVAYTKISDTLKEKWITENSEYYNENLEDDIETDIDEEIGSKINFRSYDTFEIGYPEKFTNMLCDGWKISEIHRFGDLKPTEKIIPDEQIIKDICGLNGTHSALYLKLLNPQHKESWKKAKDKIQYSLLGNKTWEELVKNFLAYIEQNHPNSDIGFYIFNPLNIIYSIYEYIKNGKTSYFPLLEILISSNSQKNLTILRSHLIVSDSDKEVDLFKVVNDVFGNNYNFFDLVGLRDIWRHDDILIEKMNFKYLNLFYQIDENETSVQSIGNDFNNKEDIDISTFISIEESINSNTKLQKNIKSLFSLVYQG